MDILTDDCIMNNIRSYKIIGLPTIDLVGSFVTFAMIGQYYLPHQINNGYIFNGLMSIPIGIASHIAFGIETPLTNYITDEPKHLVHSLGIGLVMSSISKYLFINNNSTVATTVLATSLMSLIYMFNFSHDLPKPVKKQLIKLYFKYRRWTM